MHTHCDVHATALVNGKVFGLVEGDITGLIRCALSLRIGNAMGTFRKCLRAEIESRFELLHGRLPPDALVHKRTMLSLFCRTGTNLAVRQLLMVLCPNGDWRAPKVQFYKPLQGPLSRATDEELLEHVVSGLMIALCSTMPEVYPRHRWVGCDVALDNLSIIEC